MPPASQQAEGAGGKGGRGRARGRGGQQAHTDGHTPQLLLKSPAGSPQDYGCQQNGTSNRTYYDIGAAGTCGIGIEIEMLLLFHFLSSLLFPLFSHSVPPPVAFPSLLSFSPSSLFPLSHPDERLVPSFCFLSASLLPSSLLVFLLPLLPPSDVTCVLTSVFFRAL